MTILIDPPAWPAHGTLWSHLVSDADYDELHVFARRLGVPRRGFDLDHYDVPASMYEQAVALGALPVSAKEVVHRLRDTGLRVRQVEREATTPVRRGEYLRAEWLRLGGLFGDAFGIEADRRPGDEWVDTGRELLTRWNEPHRVYHDERHLEDVLLSLDQLATRGERIAPETLLAAWFHDAVYAGAVGADAGSDELASARLAVDSLTRCGLDPELARAVGEFVVATTPGGELRDPDPALAHLLDADLAIFAAAPWRYEEYTKAVRAEYAHVPDAAFAKGRAAILAAYLERSTIYRTAIARDLWETRARANLTREVAALRAG